MLWGPKHKKLGSSLASDIYFQQIKFGAPKFKKICGKKSGIPKLKKIKVKNLEIPKFSKN